MKLRHTLAWSCIATLTCHVAAATAAADPPEDRISVTGTSTIEVNPDVVQWRITLVETDEDATAAKDRLDRAVAQILEMCDELDIAEDDLVAGNVNVQRLMDRDERGNLTVFRGYQIQRELVIDQRDAEDFDAVFTAMTRKGAVFRLYFLSSRAEELKARAQLDAVRDARAKAQAIAEVLGVTVGRPMNVAQASSRVLSPQQAAFAQALGGVRSSGSSPTAVLAPANLNVTASVQITFAIE